MINLINTYIRIINNSKIQSKFLKAKMNTLLDPDFPEYFGVSPDDFLQKYGNLIYKIILDYKNIFKPTNIDHQELFQDFFIYIEENNYERLRKYDAGKRIKPSTYLGKILKNFVIDRIRSNHDMRYPKESLEETINEFDISIPPDQEYKIPLLKKNELIIEAFEETFFSISNRKKIIFDLTYIENKKASEIAEILDVKVDHIYESNKKVKQILEENLKNRGIIIKKKKKRTPNFGV